MELKPCPFCGGESVFCATSTCSGFIACVGECKIETCVFWDNLLEHEVKKPWKEKAAQAWNRRAGGDDSAAD